MHVEQNVSFGDKQEREDEDRPKKKRKEDWGNMYNLFMSLIHVDDLLTPIMSVQENILTLPLYVNQRVSFL